MKIDKPKIPKKAQANGSESFMRKTVANHRPNFSKY